MKRLPEKGRVEISGLGCFDSWIFGDWMIISVSGNELGCKRAVRNKRGFILRHLPTGKEYRIVPDYENSYDLNYALWYVRKLDRIGK